GSTWSTGSSPRRTSPRANRSPLLGAAGADAPGLTGAPQRTRGPQNAADAAAQSGPSTRSVSMRRRAGAEAPASGSSADAAIWPSGHAAAAKPSNTAPASSNG